jgi:TonB-linked SusC/RagA family outer membrane protein
MRIHTRARALFVAMVGVGIAMGIPGQVEAQGAVINGKVTSEFGANIEGANVYINDMSISILTNAEGSYTISFPAARVNGQLVNLRVRAVGYQPQVRPVRVTAGTQTFNFVLKQDVNRLDEIVVTGVVEGTERSKVPFAVTRLGVEDIPVAAVDPLRALSGKVPGVRIAQTSGSPGSTPEIMMRGPTSINGSGRGVGPLIIVDGAIMNVGSLDELGGLDIESVEVVKGAAGASLYGTRAANGVITIKTKRGNVREGVNFSVRTEYGVSDLNSLDYGMPINHHLQLDETGTRFCRQVLSNVSHCSRTMDWMTEIMRINNVAGDTTRAPQNFQWNAATSSGQMLQNVYQANTWPNRYYNSLAQVVSSNPFTLNQVDATGKAGGVRFYVAGSYQNEAGAVRDLEGQQHRRGRVNLDYDVRSDMLVSVSTMYDNGTTDLRSGGSSNGSIFGQLLRGAPAGTDYRAIDTLGRPIIRGGGAGIRGSGNGAGTFLYDATNDNWYEKRFSNRFLGNITASYFPADWITIESNLAYDTRNRRDDRNVVKGYRSNGVSASLNNGQIRRSNRDDESLNTSLTANLRKQLMTDLNGKFTVRALYDEQNISNNAAGADIFLVKDVYTLNNAGTNADGSSNRTGTSSSFTIMNTGYLAGANLDYKDRYVLDGTFRYDGSSLFGSGNRWAPFGRISGVWRVSQEDFWNVGFMDDFRLRASRGTAGSTPRFEAQYETYSVTTNGISLGQAGNSKLRPETTTEYEFGTDMTLFGRLGLELTHARSSTEDQILLVATPASLGFSEQWKNAGTLANRTWEVALNLPVLNKRDFQWSMRGTWDRTRTFVTELFVPEFIYTPTGQGSDGFFRITDSAQYRMPVLAGSPNSGRSLTGGFEANRYGNIWGRRFYKSCGELPGATLQARCGDGREFQVNDQGYVVWVGAGNTWKEGITKNLWQTILPGSQSPWGSNAPLYWGMPIVDRPLAGEPNEGVGIKSVLGNVFPDFRFSYSNNVQWKRFTLYGLIDATIGHDIYNQGEQWGLFDFNSATFDMGDNTVETAKPIGYGWRTGPFEHAGIGGFYDLLGPNNYSVEDGSFAKIREMTLTYRVGPVRGFGDWTVGFVGRNLMTFTNYSGYDPETGVAGGQTGSGLINQVDAFDFPTLRNYTLSLSTRF